MTRRIDILRSHLNSNLTDAGMCPPTPSEEPIKELSTTPESQNEKADSADTILSNNDADGLDEEGAMAAGDHEACHPSAEQANSKEKTPMCLVNELARYNKVRCPIYLFH